ncbi:MAG TPA: hypothetical protein VK809_11395 [Bacteroidia bacterium]|nr:hypothetical protein [Bacteroidia bacterium]
MGAFGTFVYESNATIPACNVGAVSTGSASLSQRFLSPVNAGLDYFSKVYSF